MRMKLLKPELSPKCRAFVISHWGRDGLKQVRERPVSWVVYRANPKLRLLRRKRKDVPLLSVRGEVNQIRVELSTERKGTRHA
ncbi:MAG: hypothetical protein HYZ92_01480 [Candidatus Omnitrophica bacterium]|nr:hypothetical protein [Candidatus Omnitrophota bacterium]